MIDPNPAHGFTFFVGGISHCNEDDLREHFSKFGDITTVRIIMQNGSSRGYGFITMTSNQQRDVIFGTEHIVNGQKIDAKDARLNANSQQQNAMAMMQGMMPGFQQSPFGFPQQQQLMGQQFSSPFGFLPFAGSLPFGFDLAAQQRAMTTKRKVKTRRNSGLPLDAGKVTLSGLTEDITETTVREYFAKFGNVMEVTISSEKDKDGTTGKIATVRFDSEASAQSVLDQDSVHEVGTSKVEVRKGDSLRRLGDPLDMSLDDLSAQGEIGGTSPSKKRKLNVINEEAEDDDDGRDDDANGKKRRTRGGRTKMMVGLGNPMMMPMPNMGFMTQRPVGMGNTMMGMSMSSSSGSLPTEDLSYGRLPGCNGLPLQNLPQMALPSPGLDIGYGRRPVEAMNLPNGFGMSFDTQPAMQMPMPQMQMPQMPMSQMPIPQMPMPQMQMPQMQMPTAQPPRQALSISLAQTIPAPNSFNAIPVGDLGYGRPFDKRL